MNFSTVTKTIMSSSFKAQTSHSVFGHINSFIDWDVLSSSANIWLSTIFRKKTGSWKKHETETTTKKKLLLNLKLYIVINIKYFNTVRSLNLSDLKINMEICLQIQFFWFRFGCESQISGKHTHNCLPYSDHRQINVIDGTLLICMTSLD